jgi:alpha/beta superfamily hydrolase
VLSAAADSAAVVLAAADAASVPAAVDAAADEAVVVSDELPQATSETVVAATNIIDTIFLFICKSSHFFHNDDILFENTVFSYCAPCTLFLSSSIIIRQL